MHVHCKWNVRFHRVYCFKRIVFTLPIFMSRANGHQATYGTHAIRRAIRYCSYRNKWERVRDLNKTLCVTFEIIIKLDSIRYRIGERAVDSKSQRSWEMIIIFRECVFGLFFLQIKLDSFRLIRFIWLGATAKWICI